MIASKTLFALFAVVTAVSARVVPRKNPPAGWWTEGLEDYNAYHTRYLALGCQNSHGQPFFDACCHPLKKDETLQTARAPECIPSASASASASLAEPTSTVTTPDDEPPTSVTTSASTSPSSISNVATGGNDDDADDDDDCEVDDDEDDEDDEDDDDCEDDDDEGASSVSPTSTKISSSAQETLKPKSTSAPAPAPTHTSSVKSPSKPSSTKASSPAPSSDSSSSSAITGGFATYFYQNGNKGACGDLNSDSAPIAAIDYRRYGDTSKVSDLCGKKAKVTNTDNGKSVEVTIADACPTCDNSNCLDLSVGAFDAIAERSTGEVPISWEFI